MLYRCERGSGDARARALVSRRFIFRFSKFPAGEERPRFSRTLGQEMPLYKKYSLRDGNPGEIASPGYYKARNNNPKRLIISIVSPFLSSRKLERLYSTRKQIISAYPTFNLINLLRLIACRIEYMGAISNIFEYRQYAIYSFTISIKITKCPIAEITKDLFTSLCNR